MTPLVKFDRPKEPELPAWVPGATFIFSFIGAVLAFLSLNSHLKAVAFGSIYQSFCNINQTVNCDSVARSAWANLFGFPLPAVALIFYLLMILFAIGSSFTKKIRTLDIQLVLMIIVTFFSLFLLYISYFKIKAICILCIGMDLVNLILLLLAYFGDVREISFAERTFQGIKGLFELPIAVLGLGEYSESKESTVTLAGFVLGLALTFFVIYGTLKQSIYLKQNKRESFSAEMYEREIKRVVDEWRNSPTQNIPLKFDNTPEADFIKGPKDAPIMVVEFSDFQCPHCRQVAPLIEQAMQGYEGKVAFVNKAYPLDPICNANITSTGHSDACRAAKYARCAGEQGKFWEAFYALNSLEALSLDSGMSNTEYAIKSELKKIGIDPVKLSDCYDSSRQFEKIQSDIALADKLGVLGTPTFFINGKKVASVEIIILRRIFAEILKSKTNVN